MSCPQGDSKKAAAEKELAKTSIFGWGRQQKHEDAAELYKAAANSYKLSDFYAESAECYMLSADNYKIADGNINTDYLNMIIEAANCYKRIDVTKAIQTFAIAIQAYKDTARLSQAGRYQKEVAEILEADHNAIAATSAWDMAADLFSKDNKKSQAKECYLKVAVLVSTAACSSAANNDPESKSSTSSGFTRAADIFEQTGKDCLDSKLGSYSAKSHFFQCLLCTLALGDSVAVEQKLNRFKGLDHTFGTSRECQFVEKLMSAINDMSTEDFANACSDFDAITPLDPWKTSVLLVIKNVNVGANADEEDLC